MNPDSASPGLLVNVDVDDLDAAVDFYVGGLGLRVGRRLGSEVVELLGASAPVYLLREPADSQATATTSQRRHYGRHWTPVHLDFVVPDLEAALARAVAAGASQETGIRAHAWGRIVTLADPFGHGFCLVSFSERGYDAIAGST